MVLVLRRQLQHRHLRRVDRVLVCLPWNKIHGQRQAWGLLDMPPHPTKHPHEEPCMLCSLRHRLLPAEEDEEEAREQTGVRKRPFERLLWAVAAAHGLLHALHHPQRHQHRRGSFVLRVAPVEVAFDGAVGVAVLLSKRCRNSVVRD